MTTLETLPLTDVAAEYDDDTATVEHYDSDADAVLTDLVDRRNALDEQFNNLEGYDVGQAELVLDETVGQHRLLTVDISDHPGGAFKYVSALGGGLSLSEEVQTVVTASAGNYSGTLAHVCQRLGLDGVAYTPTLDKVNPDKVQGMEANGMVVRPEFESVAEAIPVAQSDSKESLSTEFLHPFDNPNGIAALTVLGDQVIGGLLKLEADGQLDMEANDVQILVQRGGGSLITAMACRVQQAKDVGLLSDNVTVHEVRPELLPNGELNPDFDGLKVDKPGSYAEPVLNDPKYVRGTYHVSSAAVADAARHVADVSDVPYETNALAGVGAFKQHAPQTERPTVFVALLTGRNASQAQREKFLDLPGLASETLDEPEVTSTAEDAPRVAGARHIGSTLLSGYTAQFRSHTPLSTERSKQPAVAIDPEALDDYYLQLEEMGIVLAVGSRQHQ